MDEKIKSIYDTIHEFKEQQALLADDVERPGAPPTKDWPCQPSTLELDRKQSRLLLAYDTSLIIIPIILLVKVALVVVAWSIDRDHMGTELDHVTPLTPFTIQLNGQMVTVFTIVFVTVVATLVKRHTLFKAQQGAYIAELEQFQGSVSLPSTLKLIWCLRAFNRKSIGLVVIWSFQYLGSQATKYEFRLTDSDRFKTSTIAIRGPNAPSIFDSGTPAQIQDFGLINSQLITSINFYNSSVRTGRHVATDMYGMALLPDLGLLLNRPDFSGPMETFMDLDNLWSKDGSGWYDMSKQSQIASLNGYANIRGKMFYFGNSNDGQQYLGEYTHSPSYLNINCSTPTLHGFEAFPNGTLTNQSISMNMTTQSPTAPKDDSQSPLRSFEIWLRWSGNNTLYSQSGSAVTTCNISQIVVDSHVHCLSNGCIQKKMRWWNNTNQANSTSYKTPFDSSTFAASFFHNLLLASGRQEDLNRPTSTNRLLSPYEILNIIYPAGADSYKSGNYTSDMWYDNPSNSPSSYSSRLNQNINQFFNTYYTLSQDLINQSPNMPAILANGTDGIFQAQSFKGALYRPQYTIAWEWIAIDILSCLVLLYAAVASSLFRKWTIAPDIFGLVSSLTRDNPYSDLPNNATTLSGLERARLLKRVKMQLCDVGTPGGQSRVGFMRVDTGKRLVVELQKDKLYV